MQEIITILRKIISLAAQPGKRGEFVQEVGKALVLIGGIISSWENSTPETPSIFGAAPETTNVDDLESCVNQLEAHASGEADAQAFGANPIVSALLARVLDLLLEEVKKRLLI